jgi:hypothetical protein
MIAIDNVDMADVEYDEFLYARTTVYVGEAIYAAWLGGFYFNASQELRELSPFGEELRNWRGACTHSVSLTPCLTWTFS